MSLLELHISVPYLSPIYSHVYHTNLEQIQTRIEAFGDIDVDGDGKITREEYEIKTKKRRTLTPSIQMAMDGFRLKNIKRRQKTWTPWLARVFTGMGPKQYL